MVAWWTSGKILWKNIVIGGGGGSGTRRRRHQRMRVRLLYDVGV